LKLFVFPPLAVMSSSLYTQDTQYFVWYAQVEYSVKTLLSGPHMDILYYTVSGHQLESLNFLPTFTVKETYIQQISLLSRCGHQY